MKRMSHSYLTTNTTKSAPYTSPYQKWYRVKRHSSNTWRLNRKHKAWGQDDSYICFRLDPKVFGHCRFTLPGTQTDFLHSLTTFIIKDSTHPYFISAWTLFILLNPWYMHPRHLVFHGEGSGLTINQPLNQIYIWPNERRHYRTCNACKQFTHT